MKSYANKFGKFGIYTDGMVYKWFKELDKAMEYWNKTFAPAECKEEWFEEYDEIKLMDMKNGEVLCDLSC